MVDAPKTHIADDLSRIHKVITRGLAVVRERVGALAGAASGSADGFWDFARCTLIVLRAHHNLEEEVAFPRLAKVANVPFAQLEAEHALLVTHLDAAEAAVADRDFGDLGPAFTEIETLWHAHITLEQERITVAAVDAALGPAEQGELGRAVGEYAARTSKPEELVLPFILFNLEPPDRAVMASRLPPAVTDELIPGPWKARWAPMAPYLLAT